MTSKLIGLCGYTGVGKDEVAKYLVANHGYTRVSFADAMREDLYRLDPVVVSDPNLGMTWEGHDGPVRLREVVNRFGWDVAKRRCQEIRRLLQVYGTEVGREGFGDNVWVERAVAKVRQSEKVVITDVRFQNEVDAVREMGGCVVRIVRPDHGPINGHASEQLDYEAVSELTIENNSDITHLQFVVDWLVGYAMRRSLNPQVG